MEKARQYPAVIIFDKEPKRYCLGSFLYGKGKCTRSFTIDWEKKKALHSCGRRLSVTLFAGASLLEV